MKKSISLKLGISIGVISAVSLLMGYMVLQFQGNKIKEEVYEETIKELQSTANYKFNAKKAVGISNAVSIANDGRIKKALRTNDRKWATLTLGFISSKMKESTPFKNIKVHVHTKENISFVRNWKTDKFGDDLSSFRSSVVKVNSTLKAVNTFEVGKAGLSLRSVVPVTDDNGDHLGSLEFMQGMNSVAKAFDKNGNGFLLLMDGSLTKAGVDSSKIFKNYIISQKFVNGDFLADAKSIHMEQLLKSKHLSSEKYFYTYIEIKDFKNKKLGIALIGKPVEKVYHSIDTAQGIIFIALGLLAALVVFILLFIGFSIKKVVSNPLHELEEAIESLIKSNDTSARVKVVSDDEIGKVARGFNDYLTHIDNGLKEDMELIKEAEEVMERVANGWYRQKLTKPTNNPSLDLLKENINTMMDETRERFVKINDLLEKYVHYDYSHDLLVEGIEKGGVVEQFINNINSMKNSITHMLVNNRTNGLTLQNSARELLNIVSTLNTSSNDAAASLEETAAALEEITSTIKNNNQNISQMTSYAATVTDAAHKGEELANNTVKSIDEINEQVITINEAISVIDQISFQTNILSLNAAVEAATAGEAGKGFAVVAQEVRNLASRSAEAAKEIKEIVEETTEKATSGKSTAQQMIQGYTHLNSNINKTIELIKEVEIASKEQQNGIVQINDAVTSLDAQTQKNASVATNANDIAVSTQNLANEIVADTDEKEFSGKNSVKAKNITVDTVSLEQENNLASPNNAAVAKAANIRIKDDKRSKTNMNIVQSNTDESDEWASF